MTRHFSGVAAAALAMLALLASLIVVVSPAQAVGTSSISGRVTLPGGAPAVGWDVAAGLVVEDGEPTVVVHTNTDDDGDYNLAALDAGTYTVYVSAGAPYFSLFYGGTTNESAAMKIVLGGGQAQSGIDVALVAGATISGTITEPGAAPAVDTYVGVVQADGGDAWYASYSAFTDESGTYSISGIPPGTYSVIASAGGAYADTFYGDATDFADATTFTVSSGASRSGIDITLTTGAAISGRVTAPRGGPAANVHVAAAVDDGSGSWTTVGDTVTDTNGDYLIAGLAPGSYAVYFDADLPLLDTFSNGTQAFGDATKYFLGSGATKADLNVTLSGIVPILTAGPNVSGTARVGSTVTCTATYALATAVTIAWYRDSAKIAGATRASFTLRPGDHRHKIACRTSATNIVGSTVAKSSSTKVVAVGPALRVRTAPSISGKAKAGKVLHARRGSWTPTASRYRLQWFVNGRAIRGATKSSLKVKKSYRHKKITLRVVAGTTGYTDGKASSRSRKIK